jgi:alpha-beta hydrolase superfamily lysophospholipase
MGGLVVAAFTRERRPELAGAVLSAPVLQLVRPPGAAQRRALGLLRRVAPRLPLPQRIDPAALSRDPEVGRAYLADPLVFQRMTVSLAAGLFDAADRTLAGGAEVGVPMLLLHGEADPLCATSGSHALHAQLRPAGCALRLYPELRHEIFNEPEHEVVFSDLLDWVRKRDGL